MCTNTLNKQMNSFSNCRSYMDMKNTKLCKVPDTFAIFVRMDSLQDCKMSDTN